MLDPCTRPLPQLGPLVRLLAEREVDWILTGSAVMATFGGRLVPNDIDVTPALDAENLRRLSLALQSIEAVPAFHPGWAAGPSVEQCAAWRPDPPTEENLDHLFVTRLGMVDVPPRLCGTYDELLDQAVSVDMGGVPVRVCALEEVMRRLRRRTRQKDLDRADLYAEMERRVEAGPTPTGVPWLLEQLGPVAL